MSLSRSLLLLGLTTGFCMSAPATLATEKTVLFTSGEGGYAAYRIPAIVVTPQQTVLVAVEARKINRSDWGIIDLCYRRSADGGRTWEPARRLVGPDDLPTDIKPNPARKPASRVDGLTINNPAWVADARSGRTFLLFCVEYMRSFIIESTDGGATFSAPREITGTFETFRQRDGYHWRVIATGPGHGVQLASGRLVMPVWLSTSDGDNPHSPSVSATIYSDDAGRTWQAGDIVAGRDGEVPSPNECIVAEAAPGRVMINMRSPSPRNRRAVAWSENGSSGWSRPEFVEALWEPVCMASLIRLPDGTLLFSNPATLEPNPARPQAVSRQRLNLGLRMSSDRGKTWSEPLVLESGPSAYSDLAVAPDGDVLCFYEHGLQSPYESMSVARVPANALPQARP
jgi:sialidase-1